MQARIRFLAALSCLFAAAASYAQPSGSYPSRPIRMVIPNAPGGSSDFVARILQPKMGEHLGVQVVISSSGGRSSGARA